MTSHYDNDRHPLRRLLLLAALTMLPLVIVQGVRSDDTAAGTALQLVRFAGPVQEEWLAQVEGTGAVLVQFVAPDGYLLWADAEARRALAVLAEQGDAVTASVPYGIVLPEESGFSSHLAASAPQQVTIQMLRHTHSKTSEAIIADLALEMLSPWEPNMMLQTARARLPATAVATIAALPDVVIVEPFMPPQRLDEKQAQTLTGRLNALGSGPEAPGYLQWLQGHGFPANPGRYPIVDIVDDGFGNGDALQAGDDITLRANGAEAGASRMAYIANCTAAADGSGADGHGHINVSIAGGFDARVGSPYRDSSGYQYGLGINPYGRFASTRVFDGNIFSQIACGGSYAGLIQHSAAKGARILSNSWGCADCAGRYTIASQTYDRAARDADPLRPGDQPVLSVFSAGNRGPWAGTVGAPADAKNVIAVGAVENQRPTWRDGCGYGPEDADNVQDLARYSSHGPGSGGRIKPDLVAPGTHIIGTASTSPLYFGQQVCDPYYPFDQRLFAASTGTSHSAPAVAGLASLATWWLEEETGNADPSPALVKALLIASASYVNGRDAGGDLPNNAQGFGMPNMDNVLNAPAVVLLDQSAQRLFDASGESWSQRIEAVAPDQPVKIVLTFTDQPGLVTDPPAPPQVNDLDLLVHTHDTIYHGNHMAGPWSVTGGEPDRFNNVEAIFLPPYAETALTIEVRAYNIAGDGVPSLGDRTDQDFALVCLNCRENNPFVEKSRTYLPVVP